MRAVVEQEKTGENSTGLGARMGQRQGRRWGDGLQVVSQDEDQKSGEGPGGQYRVGRKYRIQRSGIWTDLDLTGVKGQNRTERG